VQGLGGAFGVERFRAAQHRRRRGSVSRRCITGFGAGGQDAFDGAIPRIADLQGAGAGGIQSLVAVAVPEPDDALDGTESVDGVDLGELRHDRHRTWADLLGLRPAPRHRAQGVGHLVGG
jgi:hypothetical protein